MSDVPTAIEPPPRGWWGDTFRALRHRNYRLYFCGQLVSITGSWVQFTAQAWLAWELTKQARWPAFISAAQVLPALLLGPWGGSLADRFPKRPLIALAQGSFLILAFLLAFLSFTGWITEWHLLAIACVAGLVAAVDLPARLAFVNEMVGPDDLLNAVALNSLVFNSARAVGPMVAAILLEHLGPALCFLVNGLSYVAVLLALSAMRPTPWTSPGVRDVVPLLDAFHYLGQRPWLVLLLAFTGFVAACGWPTLALLPALAERQLGGDRGTYGFLVSAFGIGALVGALGVATLGSRVARRYLLGTGVAAALTALCQLAQARTPWFATAGCILLGGGLITYVATAQATVQLGAASHNRGRVMGVWSMVLSSSQALGNLVSGAAADRWGVAATLNAQALVLALAAALAVTLWAMQKSPR